MTQEERQRIKEELEPVINLMSYLGEGHHNTLVLLGTLVAPWTPNGLIAAFLIILVPMSLWWLYCESLFYKKMKSLKTKGLIPGMVT